jgi:hypothetical protein
MWRYIMNYIKLPYLVFFLIFYSLSANITAIPSDSDELHHLVINHIQSAKAKWISNHIVIDAILEQNKKNTGLAMTKDEILKLDKQWRAETKQADQPLINKLLNNKLSDYLKKIKEESAGIYTEIFVMDMFGLNVGQSDVTSDYWQGDEEKWLNTYALGANQVHIGEVEYDESTKQYQIQASISIENPKTGKNIGAITLGIEIERLELYAF